MKNHNSNIKMASAKAKTFLRMIMQKTQLEKNLVGFTHKFRLGGKTTRKEILTFESCKEVERHREHPTQKKQWALDSTYLKNIKTQKMSFPSGSKEINPTGSDASDDALLV
jgi:hypothetical protein